VARKVSATTGPTPGVVISLRQDLILAHDLKQLAVKHAELLAQDPAGDQ